MQGIASKNWIRISLAVACVAIMTVALAVSAEARTIQFAGMTWDVKSGTALGPGPNDWSDDVNDVWVDAAGDLHLTLKPDSQGNWRATEIVSQQAFGYGEYRWKLKTNLEDRLDANGNPRPNPIVFDHNVVLGLFTYEDRGSNPPEEIDIEFARWGDPNAPLGNFTNQTADPIPTQTFNVELEGDANDPSKAFTTHLFRWAPNQIDFASLHGHRDDNPGWPFVIAEWRYDGADLPVHTGNERVHMNLWGFKGMAPSDGQPVEVIISDFQFTPLGGATQTPEPGSVAWLGMLGATLLRRRRPRHG